jgi:uncharacterized protein YlzI (FlbEa/FlbD family)
MARENFYVELTRPLKNKEDKPKKFFVNFTGIDSVEEVEGGTELTLSSGKSHIVQETVAVIEQRTSVYGAVFKILRP